MMINSFEWDLTEVEELFDYNSKPYGCEDDDGREFNKTDGDLSLCLRVLPARGAVGITLLRASDGSLIVDLAVILRSPLERRKIGDFDVLYCHQCAVVPGIAGYSELMWYTYFEYANQNPPLISMQLTCAPCISVKFLDSLRGVAG